jgi:hypothetical protein
MYYRKRRRGEWQGQEGVALRAVEGEVQEDQEEEGAYDERPSE